MLRKLSRPLKHHRTALASLAIAGACAGCASEISTPILGLPKPGALAQTDTSPRPESEKASPLIALLKPAADVVGTPTEVYTRIAHGALTCWFGASGPLKAAYIYHADAEPASKGGNSEIKILVRDAQAEDPRSVRAYRVAISPSDGKTKVETENVRIPEPLASRLTADVERWSKDDAGCGENPVTAGWTAEQVVDAKANKKINGKSKSP